MLGKRKREVAIAARQRYHDEEHPTTSTTPSSAERDIFRTYFESTFEPLPESQTETETPELLEDEEEAGTADEDSEWEGLSDTEQEKTTVEIIEHRAVGDEEEEAGRPRPQYKTFMSSRPPKDIPATASLKPDKKSEEDDPSEALNLKHDLDLQRLLNESHLLEQAKTSSTPGSHRHKAVDMRMQSLGSKGSLFHQEKMPMAHRKGILAKSTAQEATRRREARENGVILEKAPGKSRSSAPPRRERGVDVPTVGKFRGGTLRLSKKDVLDIQGPARGKTGRR